MTELPQNGLSDATHRRFMLRLLGVVSGYYVLVGLLLTGLLAISPGLSDYIPVGGAVHMARFEDPALRELEDALLSADNAQLEAVATRIASGQAMLQRDWVAGMLSLFGAMFATLVLMLPVSWVYKTIHRDELHDHSLDETTLVLPAVVAGIVLIVQHSLALAFSLAGIVAGVRFRRALTDTFDTLFILVAIGVGIAAGTRSLEIAAALTVFFNYATIGVGAFGDGLESRYAAKEKRARKARKAAEKQAAAEASAHAQTPTDA